jgi:hypothetical protein
MPFPAAVALDDCNFPVEKSSVGDSAEKAEPGWEGDLCVFREVDKPA